MRKDIRLPNFESPGALIAGLPAIFGFVPAKSLVLVTLDDDGRVGATMRIDLDDELYERLAELADIAAGAGAQRVIAVFVDADGADCQRCVDEHAMTCDALRVHLRTRGLQLYAGYVVDRIAAGGRWCCVDRCGVGGDVEDPAASPLALAAVLDGRRLHARREDLVELLGPADAERRAAMAVLTRQAAEAAAAQRHREPAAWAKHEVQAAMAVASRIRGGAEVPDAALASVGQSLTDIPVRDTLYGLAVAENAGEAEELWMALARVLPRPWRVEALVLLAFNAYARGDGPLAGVALEAALTEDPSHRMGSMLGAALHAGMPPAKIRLLARTGYRLAAQLGVRLPPRCA